MNGKKKSKKKQVYSSEVLMRKAQSYIKRGEKELAKGALIEIIKKWPENLTAKKLLTSVDRHDTIKKKVGASHIEKPMNLYREGKFTEADNCVDQLAKTYGQDTHLLLIKGAAQFSLQNLNGAIETYNAILQTDPFSVEANSSIGAVYRQKGDIDKAIEYYEKALSINPKHVNTLLNMGNSYQDLGEFSIAIDSYKRIVKIDPGHIEGNKALGLAYLKHGDTELSVKSFKKISDLDPNDQEIHSNLGLSYFKLGKINQAIDSFRKYIETNPRSAETWNNLGSAEKERGDLVAAATCYERAIELDKSLIEAHSNLGLVYEDIGQINQAIKSYDTSLRLDPKNVDVATNLAKLLYLCRRYDEARKLFGEMDTSEAKYWHLKCTYKLGEEAAFHSELDSLANQKEVNSVLGSLVSRGNIRYGRIHDNLFCNLPFDYCCKVDLKKEYDFSEIFIRFSNDILNESGTTHKSQPRLTNGIQTSGNVFAKNHPLAKDVERILIEEIERYKQRFYNVKEGIFKNWPQNYRISGWLVSMRTGGTLSAHMHDPGWITGSLYINVPHKENSVDGNIVVSLEDVNDENHHSKNRRIIEIETGDLFLFPSSLLHYTIPFTSNENRIVLAFDMIPVP
ncbi:tetratricopeptide repeat protein [Gammaproteobacteria bacterium]|nr:tetratricopeptide repeat protein [Gammaproteobacteria bacterium]